MKVQRILIMLFLCLFLGTYLVAEEVGTIKNSVNLRSKPTISSEKIETLKKNAQVTIIEEKDGWFKIKTSDGKTGWASGKFINVVESIDSSKTTVNKEETTAESKKESSKLGKVKESDNVRPETKKDENRISLTIAEDDTEKNDSDIFSLPSEADQGKNKAAEIDQSGTKIPEKVRTPDVPTPEQPLAAGDKDFASGYDTPDSALKRDADIKDAREGIKDTYFKYYEIKYQDIYSEIQMYYKGDIKEQDIQERKRRLQKYYKVFYAKDDVAQKKPLREILYEDYLKKQVTTYRYTTTPDGKDVNPKTLVIIHYRGDKEDNREEYLLESYTYDFSGKLANVRYYEPYLDVFRPARISFYNEAGQVYFSINFNKEGVRELEKYYEVGLVKELHYFDPAKAPKEGGPYRIEKFYTQPELMANLSDKEKANYSSYIGNQKSIAEYFKKEVPTKDNITNPVFYALPETKCNRIYQRDYTYDGYLAKLTVYYLEDDDFIKEKKVVEWTHALVEKKNEEGNTIVDAAGNPVTELVYNELPAKRYDKKGNLMTTGKCDCEPEASTTQVIALEVKSNPKFYAVDRDGLIDKNSEFKNIKEAQTFRNYYLVYFRRTVDEKSKNLAPFTSLVRGKEIIGTLPPSTEITPAELVTPAWVIADWSVDFVVFYKDNQIDRVIYYNDEGNIFRVDFYTYNPNNDIETKQNPYRYFYHFYGGSKNSIMEEIAYSNDPTSRGKLDYITRFRDDGRIDYRDMYHGEETYTDSPDLIAEDSFVKRRFTKVIDWATLKKNVRQVYGRSILNEPEDRFAGLITQEILYEQNVPVKNTFYTYTPNGREIVKEEKIKRETSE